VSSFVNQLKGRNRYQKITIAILLFVVLLGCAATPTEQLVTTPPDGFEASVVMARAVIKGKGPFGVAEKFTQDGKVVAHSTLRWKDEKYVWGKQKFESRWYNNETLIKKSEVEHNVARPPYYIWTEIYPAALGAGIGRFELYWNGLKVAEKRFEIVGPYSPLEPGVKSL
jgi:hypothetical protein